MKAPIMFATYSNQSEPLPPPSGIVAVTSVLSGRVVALLTDVEPVPSYGEEVALIAYPLGTAVEIGNPPPALKALSAPSVE